MRVKLKPVHALVGSEAFLQVEKLRSLLRQAGDMQRIDIDGERAELADVLDELRSFSMFGAGGRLVVVRNGDDLVKRFREPLEAYLGHPSESSTLVLRMSSLPKTQRIYKLISKIGQIEECEPPRDLARWVIDRGKSQHKIAVGPDAARLLVELIGGDLGRLDNELAKLALLSPEGKVDARNIGGSVVFQREQEMYDMTNELLAGKTADALRRWRQLIQLDPSAEFRAVTWISMWLEDVRAYLSAKQSGGEREVLAKLGWKYRGERMRDFTNGADSMGQPGLTRAIHRLAEIDHQSKTGVGDAAENVERFIVSLSA